MLRTVDVHRIMWSLSKSTCLGLTCLGLFSLYSSPLFLSPPSDFFLSRWNWKWRSKIHQSLELSTQLYMWSVCVSQINSFSIKTQFVLIDNNYSRILLIGMFAQLKTLFGGKTKTVYADICLGAGCHAIPSNTNQFHKMPCNTLRYHVIPCHTKKYHVMP